MLRYTLTTPEGSSGLVAAVSVAQAVMQIASIRRWADLEGELPETVILNDEQFQTLAKFQTEISFLRTTAKKSKDSAGIPGVSMAVCPVCGKWMLLIPTGDPPKKCTLTSACTGSPSKVPVAARTKSTDTVAVPASLFDDAPTSAPAPVRSRPAAPLDLREPPPDLFYEPDYRDDLDDVSPPPAAPVPVADLVLEPEQAPNFTAPIPVPVADLVLEPEQAPSITAPVPVVLEPEQAPPAEAERELEPEPFLAACFGAGAF